MPEFLDFHDDISRGKGFTEKTVFVSHILCIQVAQGVLQGNCVIGTDLDLGTLWSIL